MPPGECYEVARIATADGEVLWKVEARLHLERALTLPARIPCFERRPGDVHVPFRAVAARREDRGHPALRFVAVTGYGQPDDRARGERAGFETYLVEPIDLDVLARALAQGGMIRRRSRTATLP